MLQGIRSTTTNKFDFTSENKPCMHLRFILLIITSSCLFSLAADSDYTTRTFTLDFLSSDEGTTTLCSNVPIIDDQVGNEPVEAFCVSFVSISPAGLQGATRETCVFIVDDDGMLVWRASPFTREEGSGVMRTRLVLLQPGVQHQSDCRSSALPQSRTGATIARCH